jgi:phage shock protein PspC (stress-responsive transcriptional regulator)
VAALRVGSGSSPIPVCRRSAQASAMTEIQDDHQPQISGAPAAPGEPSAPPPTTTAFGQQILDQLRQIQRGMSGRKIAGVCQGVANQLRIDPLLLRVVLAVLVVFGGAGLALYAVGWLLLPLDDGTPSIARRAVTDGSRNADIVVGAVVLALIIPLGIVDTVSSPDDGTLLLLIVLALGAWALWTNRERLDRLPQSATHVVPVAPAATMAAVKPPRSMLTRLTLSAALLACGALLAADLSGLNPPAASYPALVLAIVAGGLIVGTWRGRGRGLIAAGVIAVLATAIATVGDHTQARFGGNNVDKQVVITEPSELPVADSFGSGEVTYNLSNLRLPTGVGVPTARLGSRIGLGQITVIVPRTVDVTVTATCDVGELSVFDIDQGGNQQRVTNTDVGPDGTGGGQLVLDLSTSLGHLEVRRATS